MQTGNTDFIYRNVLDKACFQHDIAYGKSKDLTKRTQSDKVLRDRVFKIASDPKYDGYQIWLASLINKFFDKKSSGSRVATEPNYQLANELHKQIRKFERRKVYSSFRDNIWGVDLAYNEGKSLVVERFIRTLKNKIFKHMTAVSNNIYFDMLDNIVNKYNNTVHRTKKMKPTDVTWFFCRIQWRF